MSKPFARTLALVVMGVCLGALAALLLRERFSPAQDVQAEKPVEVEIPSALEVAARHDSDAISGYEATIERLRGELEVSVLLLVEMEVELTRLEDEIAGMVIVNGEVESDGTLAREREAKTLLRRIYRLEALGGHSGFEDEDALLMLAKLARLGDAGVAGLLDMASNDNFGVEAGVDVFEMIAYLPSIKALEFLLYPPEDLAIEANYSPYESVGNLAAMAESIDPTELAPYRGALHRLALSALEQGKAKEAMRMIGALALVHDHPASQQLLRNPTWRRDHADYLLKTALWVGNDQARTFIYDLALTHPSADIRFRATEILAGW